MQNTNLLIIFLTGLTTGGLTCLALQGGLLTSVIATKKSDVIPAKAGIHSITPNSFFPILSFLLSKLFIHTILGFALGFLGASISLSPITRGWLQIIIGIYLFGIAGNLLNLHPFFRYFIITPPKFLAKLAKKSTNHNPTSDISQLTSSVLLGLLTVFLPCATTQAMEVVAIGTGNPLYGAAIMFSFILGTSPTFLVFGFLLNKSGSLFQKHFPTIAATSMFIMSIYSINAGVGLTGSIYTIQNFIEAATQSTVSRQSGTHTTNSVLGDQIQTATINVTNSGYTPTSISLKKGVPTKLKLITSNVQNCSRSFTIPKLGLQKLLPETGETTVEFIPDNLGPLAFSCSMGMYTGRFNVVD